MGNQYIIKLNHLDYSLFSISDEIIERFRQLINLFKDNPLWVTGSLITFTVFLSLHMEVHVNNLNSGGPSFSLLPTSSLHLYGKLRWNTNQI